MLLLGDCGELQFSNEWVTLCLRIMVGCEQGLCLALWQLLSSCRNLCSLLLSGELRSGF